MRLKSLELSGFRNLLPQSLEFNKRVSFIYGRNGQGKTSLLEAIYLLSQQKSFREVKMQELVSWGAERKEAFVSAKLEADGLEKTLSYKIERGRRSIFINDNKVTEAKLFFGEIPVIAFTPENMVLVQGAPLERRKYLDKLLTLLDPAYLDSLMPYQRALRQRNALLREEEKSEEQVRKEIYFWDEILAKNARKIASKRLELLKEIKSRVISLYQRLTSEREEMPQEEISLSYKSDFLDEDLEVCEEEKIRKMFLENLEKDSRYQRTTLGIQADDFDLFIDSGKGEKKARHSASQGQARSFSLALILAAIEEVEEKTKKLPIILLDDVESELDELRRAALEQIILEKNNQVFISSTEPNPRLKCEGAEVSFYSVLNGEIRPLQ